jgi:hypothetical protein
MAIQSLPLSDTIVLQLFELACTPFRLASHRERWDSFGWSCPRDASEFGFQVQIPGGWWLGVDPLGEQVVGATLAFYCWEDYSPQFHDDLQEYKRQRHAYDVEFEAAASRARRVLPAPVQSWADADKDAHKAVVWEGTDGLLILQQASFDSQFGIEIDFWLEGCSMVDFRPSTPLIDWLCKRSQNLHAEHGFPPLRW